jgi:hypothetical protein
MFFKTVSPSDWSNLVDQGITHIVPAGSHGFGNNDRINFMQKTAASEKFLHEIGNIKLGDGDIPVHINAIGSTEYSGFNRKGDAFSEQTCKDWHPTFVSEGKLYLHHQNRDPDNNFGKVASACYNDKMHRIELLVIANGTKEAAARNNGHVLPHEFLSKLEKNAEVPVSMGCFIKHDQCLGEGTLVNTEIGYRPIEGIALGDRVWTHQGTLEAVNHLYSSYSDDVGSLKIVGVPAFDCITSSHPFYAIRGSKLRDGGCNGTAHGQPIRHTDFRGHICGRCEKQIDLEPEWITAAELQVGDFVVSPIDTVTERKFYAGDFGYLLGMYIGDGCLSRSRKGTSDKHDDYGDKVGGIAIACDAKQTDILEKIKQVCATVSDGRVKCYSAGKHEDGTPRQGIAVNLTDRELALRLLRFGGEYARGKRLDPEVYRWSSAEKADILAGYIDADGYVNKDSGAAVICSINLGILLDMQRLCFSIGIAAFVGIHNRVRQGYGGQVQSEEEIGIASQEFSWAIHIPMSCTNRITTSAKLNRQPQSELSRKGASQLLRYDNYMLLPVKQAWTKLETEKGLTRVYNIRVSKAESYIVNSIAVHNCSICGNQSRTRAQYCDETNCIDIKTGEHFFGCKRGLTKVAADGRAQYVENVDPHFFDISFVGVPADRTGYGFRADYIHKTASAVPNPTPVTCVGLDNETGWTRGYKFAMDNVMSKLRNYEQVCLNDPVELSNAYAVAALPSDIELGNKLASLTPYSRFQELANLSASGVLLSPDSFVAAFGLDKTAASDIYSNSCGVYQQLPTVLQNESDQCVSAFLMKMDKSLKEKTASYHNVIFSPQQIQQYAVNPNILGSNVMRGVITTHSQTKHAACYPQGFADTYALYKAAALCLFPPTLQDFGVKYAVWQNSLPRLFERLSN